VKGPSVQPIPYSRVTTLLGGSCASQNDASRPGPLRASENEWPPSQSHIAHFGRGRSGPAISWMKQRIEAFLSFSLSTRASQRILPLGISISETGLRVDGLPAVIVEWPDPVDVVSVAAVVWAVGSAPVPVVPSPPLQPASRSVEPTRIFATLST